MKLPKRLSQRLLSLGMLLMHVLATVPLVMFSHKLVPRVQGYVNNFNHLPFPLERTQEVTGKLVDPCTSDAYVLVNQPGLTLDDLQDPSVFVFLRTYMFMSSTLAVIPRSNEVLDLDGLSRRVQRKCQADEMVVESYNEVETYIDIKKRVIRLNFPELPDETEKRKESLMRADDALRRTLRKLPSPDHTIIYTSQTMGNPNKRDERRWSKMDIFADITKDASRDQEFERNNNALNVEREFPKKRTNFISPKLYEESSFVDPELIAENELLILAIVLITGVLLLHQLLALLWWAFKRIVYGTKGESSNQKKTKNPERKGTGKRKATKESKKNK